MAYQPTDLKKGVVCQIDGKPYRVIEYGQKVMGRGGSIVNVKLKNLIDGIQSLGMACHQFGKPHLF
jgi:translation elongation factor P/translation initiation factor 5A